MRGILRKIVQEIWLATLLFGVAFFIVEVLLNLVLPQILDQMTQMLDQMPFMRQFVSALLGIDIEGEISAQLMQAFVWVHPTVLTILWAHETMICTRFPAAEVDRGTIDVLLALPVSRRAVYLCETLGWLASGALLLAAGASGYALGAQITELAFRPEPGVVLRVLFNLFCVYVAVGGVGFLISSFCDRRGRAVFSIFAVILVSFLLNFLAQSWAPAKSVAFLSVLNYYQPAAILKNGVLIPTDIATLLAVGLVCWIIGGEVTARRSLCTT